MHGAPGVVVSFCGLLRSIHGLGKCILPSYPWVFALHQNFKDQCLICGSRSIQTLWSVKGALILKCGPREGELPRPVDAPAPREVILLTEASNGKVTGGNLQLLDFNASGPSGNDDHGVILICFMLVEV